MDVLLYLYTILVMGVCIIASAVALSAFFVSRRKTYLFATVGLFCYFLELVYTFLFEFTGWNLAYPVELMYAIEHPFLQTLLALGVLQPAWMALCDYVNECRRWVLWMPAFLFVVLSLGTVALLPEGALTQWLYYTWRQAFVLGCLGFAFTRARGEKNTPLSVRIRRMRPLLIATLVLTLSIIAEDAIVIIVLSPDLLANESLMPLYASERNFLENVLLILYAALTLRRASQTLRLRFKEPPAPDNPDLAALIGELIPAYGERYGLTLREQEILAMLLHDKSNQAIATELQVSLGTVKTHVHHLLKKTGADSRQDVVRDFWKN